MKKLLWLDDIRDPFTEKWNNEIAKYIINPLTVDIYWVRDYSSFRAFIEEHGLPDIISFDHDLADEHYTPEEYWDDYDKSKEYQDSKTYREETGLDCAKFLTSYCKEHKLDLPNCNVHSANPVGANNIRNEIKQFYKK